MIRLLAKARQALLTDPVTGEAIDPLDLIEWACVASMSVIALLVLSLGLGPGQ